MINAVIVEDSELARLELSTQLADFSQIKLVGEAQDVVSAISLIESTNPDLVFMDIDLPGGNAFDILAALTVVPRLIFTTAFDHYALESFEFNTVDYLLKPIKQARLIKAIEKLDVAPPETESEEPLDHDSQFFVKDGEKCWLVKVEQVRYIEAEGNYSRIYFADQSPMLYRSLNKIEQRLDESRFFRANRQQLVNLHYVQRVEPWVSGGLQLTLQCGTEVEISRRQTTRFKQLMSL